MHIAVILQYETSTSATHLRPMELTVATQGWDVYRDGCYPTTTQSNDNLQLQMGYFISIIIRKPFHIRAQYFILGMLSYGSPSGKR